MSIVWSLVVFSQPDISIIAEGGIVGALFAGRWGVGEGVLLQRTNYVD